ncbi:hypothetical protein GGI43DRAFT_99341 [Trichoderma evansii]
MRLRPRCHANAMHNALPTHLAAGHWQTHQAGTTLSVAFLGPFLGLDGLRLESLGLPVSTAACDVCMYSYAAAAAAGSVWAACGRHLVDSSYIFRLLLLCRRRVCFRYSASCILHSSAAFAGRAPMLYYLSCRLTGRAMNGVASM